jgi:MFS family permease
MSLEQMAQVMSAWYAGYAVMQLPSGWFADRWGSKRVLVALAIGWSIWTGLVPLALDHPTLLVIWFSMGAAQAGIFPCAAKAIGHWFGDEGRASASGLLASSQALGAAIAPALTVWLMVPMRIPWQEIFVGYAVVGILWAGLYAAVIPALPATALRAGAHEEAPAWTRRDWLVLATDMPMLLLCAQQFFRAAGMVFFYTWFPTFLRQTREMALTEAGYMTSLVALGAMCGGIVGGFTSDAILRRTGNRRLSRQGLAVVGLTGCCILVLVALEVPDKQVAVVLFALAAFSATFGGFSGYTVTIDYGGRRVGTVFSIMNMSGNIGAALSPLVVGMLRERTGSWYPPMYFFISIMALDAVIWSLLNPKGTLFKDDDAPR